jgi:DNA-directed RNA polymerase sigma subunit (sigma70/sigma32)
VSQERAHQERERQLEAELRGQADAYKRLSPDEERELLGRRPDAGTTATLVEHNLDLVVIQAESHRGRGLPFSDLYQEGTVGLVDAIGAYTGRGDFRDFASLHIGLQIDSLIQAEAEDRKEAEVDILDLKTLETAQVMFRRGNRREATPEEMLKLLGWEETRLERIERMLDLAREHNDAATISFLDDSDAEDLGIDFVEADEAPDPRRRPTGAGPDD